MRTIVLAALLGTLVFADGTLKQKLGQSKKLAQVNQADCEPIDAQAGALDGLDVAEPDLRWCDCEGELPGLGAGVQATNSL